MPTIERIRSRIIKVMQSNPKISKRRLLALVGMRYQNQTEKQIDQLVSELYLVQIGAGRRGSPIEFKLGPVFPKNICPFCSQVIL
jgi:hypothetical protein